MPARKSVAVSTAKPRIGLLVLQPTPFCNIDCSYCYLPNRESTARMSLDTVELAFRRVFESPRAGQQLEVAWHAGEPLAVPRPWYEEAMVRMARMCPAQLRLRHCFQTNGLLVNEDWSRFFARTNAAVGISIDGPADLHDLHRRTRRGGGTHKGAMRAVRLLQDHGLSFHAITVLTEPALNDPNRLFDFYVRNGIKEVGFNIEEIEGIHSSSSLAHSDAEAKFRRFISRFFNLVWDAPNLLKVREFENAIGLILSDEPVRDQQNLPFAIVSVGWDGTISTFSPEFLDVRHPRVGSFEFGTVATHSLSAVELMPSFQSVSEEISRGVAACERDCLYFRWCGGGAPANKLFETGRLDGTETMHCRLTRQAVLDEVTAGIEARAAFPRCEAT